VTANLKANVKVNTRAQKESVMAAAGVVNATASAAIVALTRPRR